ncbi:MAG TPA: CsgG/HfaB family protein [Thermoanaerobaculia bacterium]|nr:CsgG/HfaB family protein [Thermoanaerobaculia bacterium]
MISVLAKHRILLAIVAGLVLWAPAHPLLAYEEEIEKQARELAKKIAKAGIARVAVVDLEGGKGQVTEMGTFIAQMLSNALVDSKQGFAVIGRSNLRSLLKEHELGTTGLIDPSTVKELGKFSGVDALVGGTAIRMGDRIKVVLEVSNVETAEVLATLDFELDETDSFKELDRRVIEVDRDRGPKNGGDPHTLQHGGITFAFEKCRRSRATVICSIRTTSRGQERDLSMSGTSSQAIDTSGKVYPVSTVRIGAAEGSSIRNRLPADVEIVVEVKVPGVSDRVSRFQALDLQCGTFSVTLRDLPIQR